MTKRQQVTRDQRIADIAPHEYDDAPDAEYLPWEPFISETHEDADLEYARLRQRYN